MAALVIAAQALALLVWVVWQLAMHPPGCADDMYCDVLDGPLVRQAPIGFVVAAAWATMAYRVARGFPIARWTALVGELLLAVAVMVTDVWGEDVVDGGYITLSALLTAAALVAHDAGNTIRHLRREAS